MEIQGSSFLLRPWKPGDEEAIVKHADNRRVWINLRTSFPHPYTLEDARSWVERCQREKDRGLRLAIVVGDEPIGAVGVEVGYGSQSRVAEIGYWLGESYWGRGIVSEAARLVTAYAFEHLAIDRLEAAVLESNPASARVLEKAGYRLKGKLRKTVRRPGRSSVELLFVKERRAI